MVQSYSEKSDVSHETKKKKKKKIGHRKRHCMYVCMIVQHVQQVHCMYVCMIIMDQPSKVTNPARGQLNREN